MPKKRIRGRIVTKDNINDFYPKFTVLNEDPFLQGVFETFAELDAGVSAQERIFEPLETGLGTETDVMYVKSPANNRTFVFIYDSSIITWGSEVVTFGDPVDFSGSIIEE